MAMSEIDKNFEDNIDENHITRRFRGDILIFLIFANLAMFFALMFKPTLMTKPAIYLYPNISVPMKYDTPAIDSYQQKATKINITLSKTILIDIDIPKYHNGWNVLAYPDGKIVDLQPEYTDCSKLKNPQHGFEYAYRACENNKYPYIFWEGTQVTKQIPNKNQGWLVKKSDVEKFLNSRLDEMAFIKTEKKDFLDYWQDKLNSVNSNYFLIYFLQNNEVDKYAPMQIKPKPDSINRILMIVQPLDKPVKVKVVQSLLKISRKGFSVVEWGGTIKKKNIWSH